MGVGWLKVHVVPHSTVLFVAQISAKGPLAGAVTVKGIEHCSTTPMLLVTVTVMMVMPGPTSVPANGVWPHFTGGGGCTVLMRHWVNRHKSGTTAMQLVTFNTACVRRHWQSMTWGWAWSETAPRRAAIQIRNRVFISVFSVGATLCVNSAHPFECLLTHHRGKGAGYFWERFCRRGTSVPREQPPGTF